jgi:two-component system, chemotaxis family, chemotaxis protein CheY
VTPSVSTTLPAVAPSPAARRGLQVLYAEDLPELRQLMRLVLTPEGHDLEAVADGSLALARLQEPSARFDLLITDHHMPVMNGLDLVRAVRQLPYAGRIIVFSSELDPQVHDAYVDLRVDQVLAKPVRPAALRRLIADLFPA